MNILPYFVLLPLGGAFLLTMLNALFKKDIRFTFTEVSANLIVFSLFVCSFFLFGKTGSYAVGGWAPPLGINFLLDGLSALMLSVVNLIAFSAVLFSVNYMKQYTARRYYYSLFLLMLAGMNGVILSGDLFNLFVFVEIASIASYALVGFGTEAEELEASFKYMVMGGIASTFILLSIALLYSQFGVLNMAYISEAISKTDFNYLLKFSLFLFIAAFSVKGAFVPFHAWLPDAHPSAPAPISAMLSGVLIKTLGIYALLRVGFSVFNYSFLTEILNYLGIITIVIGGLMMLGQDDIKRLMAYSSISNVGLIILGISIGTPLGILGGLFHLLSHSIFKSLLFLNSGAIFYRIKTRDLREMGGLNKVMPVTGGTSLIASLSISGIPPFNGFFSKLIIIIACVQSGHPVFAVWAVLGSILTLASFMKVQKFAFFGALKEKYAEIKEVPFLMSLSMIILAVLCIVTPLLLLPQIKDVILTPAVDAILHAENYMALVIK